MKNCVKLPVKKAIKIVPIPTPTSSCKKVSDKKTELPTKIRSLIVLTNLTLVLKKTDKSFTKPSKGISGIDDLTNKAAPKLIKTHPTKKYMILKTKISGRYDTKISKPSTIRPNTKPMMKLKI